MVRFSATKRAVIRKDVHGASTAALLFPVGKASPTSLVGAVLLSSAQQVCSHSLQSPPASLRRSAARHRSHAPHAMLHTHQLQLHQTDCCSWHGLQRAAFQRYPDRAMIVLHSSHQTVTKRQHIHNHKSMLHALA